MSGHLQDQFRAREAIGIFNTVLEQARKNLRSVRDEITDEESKKAIDGVLDGSLPIGSDSQD